MLAVQAAERNASVGAQDLPMLRAIIDGIREQPHWQTFLSLVLDRFGASYANIVFRRSRNGKDELHEIFSGPPVPAELTRAYADRDSRYDPIRWYAMVPGHVYRLPELFGTDRMEDEPFYRNHLHVAGIDWARLVAVHGDSGNRAWITIARTGTQPDFGPREDALLAEVATLFTSALDVFCELESVKLARAVAESMIEKLNFSFMVLDRDGRVLIDHEARGKSSRRFLTIGGDGRVHLRSAAADRTLRALLREFDSGPRLQTKTIHIEDESDINILVTSTMLDMHFASSTPVAILYFPSGPAAEEGMCQSEPLRQLFGLTDSEARLGALICRGMTVKSASACLGLTEHTGRAYLKRVLVKTGVNRQSELVRKVMSSVIALA
jgi:DNA-binding CsgD family transcriptional regulator